MFSRSLTEKEIRMIQIISEFVREKHSRCLGHDYSHVLEVTKNAIKIGQRIPEEVDPFILICGALFHDLGRVGVATGAMHGIRGAALAEQFLKASWIDKATGKRILRIITRHTPTSHLPPEMVEEKVVFDADTLDRFGWIGLLRGIMGKKGSIEEIIEDVIAKRSQDYNSLVFEESRKMGDRAREQTLYFLGELRKALAERSGGVREISLPREVFKSRASKR
jgi:hypothetical protein